jgi:protoporphyrinogen oxidase
MLNAPIENADTEIFFNTIKKIISNGKDGLSLNHSMVSLLDLFKNFEKKVNKISTNKLIMNTKISKIFVEENICKGVVINGEQVISDYVISTIPPQNLSNISEQFENFNNVFSSSSILSVYL